MDCRYKARWRARFQGKIRVVTDELLYARVFSDRLFLSMEDSDSSFFLSMKYL